MLKINNGFATATACAKAIIVGEHAVIAGVPAIAIPVFSLHTTVTIKASTKSEFRYSDQVDPAFLQNFLDQALQLLGQEPRPFQVDCQTTIPGGVGLGGSAALCSVVLTALRQLYGIPADIAAHIKACTDLEGFFHGKSSGLDTAVVSLRKPIIFTKGAEPIVLQIPTRVLSSFLLVNSGEPVSTKLMVEKVKELMSPTLITKFQEISQKTQSALLAEDFDTLGQLIQRAGALLGQLGLMTEPLQEICDFAASIGALGAKVTGKGGGGCALVLLDPAHVEEQHVAFVERFGKERVYLADSFSASKNL